MQSWSDVLAQYPQNATMQRLAPAPSWLLRVVERLRRLGPSTDDGEDASYAAVVTGRRRPPVLSNDTSTVGADRAQLKSRQHGVRVTRLVVSRDVCVWRAVVDANDYVAFAGAPSVLALKQRWSAEGVPIEGLLDVTSEAQVLQVLAAETPRVRVSVDARHCIVHCFGAVALGDGSFVTALEFASHGDLAAQLRAREARSSGVCSVDEATVVHVLMRVFAALAHVHACGFIHRDVKPANVLLHVNSLDDAVPVLGPTSDVWLADFGVCVPAREAAARACAAGTPAYMSPEMLQCVLSPATARGCSFPTDVWSAGILALDLMCAGRPVRHPTHAASAGAGPLAVQSVYEATRDAAHFVHMLHEYSRELRAIVQHCLSLDADARPTAEWVALALQACAAATDTQDVSTGTSVALTAAACATGAPRPASPASPVTGRTWPQPPPDTGPAVGNAPQQQPQRATLDGERSAAAQATVLARARPKLVRVSRAALAAPRDVETATSVDAARTAPLEAPNNIANPQRSAGAEITARPVATIAAAPAESAEALLFVSCAQPEVGSAGAPAGDGARVDTSVDLRRSQVALRRVRKEVSALAQLLRDLSVAGLVSTQDLMHATLSLLQRTSGIDESNMEDMERGIAALVALAGDLRAACVKT